MTGPVTVTEWGVRYQFNGSDEIDNHGPSEALARSACDTYRAITTQPLQDVTLVTRQVTYSEWQEVTEVNDAGTWDPDEYVEPYDPADDEPGQAAPAQDADAETGQAGGEDSHVHEANPF